MELELANYKINGKLGEGGMAVVYLAEHQFFHSKVAVKVLNKEYVHNENIRKRFIAEARNMFKMSHPNIVRVTDMLDNGETVAFVMEYIDGESLKEYLERKGKLGDNEIHYILLQMLDALEYVHSQGLVHRDIKPSNFMLSPQGKVKLMDFGIAKQLNPDSQDYTSTGTNQQMGTPLYMSPEQIRETANVTIQSDIYSLGVVLWQMLSGEKPYKGITLSDFDLKQKIVQDRLSLIGTKWDLIIQKATEKDLEKRYRNIWFFKEAVKEAEKSYDQEEIILEDKTIIEPTVVTAISEAVQTSSGAIITNNNSSFFLIILISFLSPVLGIILFVINLFKNLKFAIYALISLVLGIILEVYIFYREPHNFYDDWQRVLIVRSLLGFWSDLLA